MAARETPCALYRQWPVYWCDNPQLKNVSDQALRVYLYMATGPCMTQLMGICRVGPGEIADALRREVNDVELAIQELEESGAVIFDAENRVAYLPGKITDFPPGGPNDIPGAAKALARFPICPALVSYVQEALERLSRESWKTGRGDQLYVSALKNEYGGPLPVPLAEGLPDPSPTSDRDSDSDSDPDREREDGGPLSICLSKKQEDYAAGLLRPHGLDLKEWAYLKSITGEISSEHLDQIIAEYEGKAPTHRSDGWKPPEERGITDEQH